VVIAVLDINAIVIAYEKKIPLFGINLVKIIMSCLSQPARDASYSNSGVCQNLSANRFSARTINAQDIRSGAITGAVGTFTDVFVDHLHVTGSEETPDPQVTFAEGETTLDLSNVADNTKFVQTYAGMTVVCFVCPETPKSAQEFTIVTNDYGIFLLNSLPNIHYSSSIYLPPNKTSTFNLVDSGVGGIWNLTSDVSVDITISPALAWMTLFCQKLPTPPPKTARFLASLGLAMYQSLVTYPALFDLAVTNEVGKMVMNYYLPAVDTSATYNAYPKLSPADLVTVTAYVTNLVINTLAYNPTADSPVYVGAPPVDVPPFLWSGSNPILPNWSLVNYLGMPVDYVPTVSDPATTMYADAQAMLVTQANLTEAQVQIAKYFVQSPPAHLMAISCDLLSTQEMSEFQYAQNLALLTLVISNAAVCAWTVKFTYWGSRPFMFIPAALGVPFTPIIPTPNFPGQMSGHSTFGGAWGAMLGYQVPRFSRVSNYIGNLASLARIYGGIHFQIDCVQGNANGTALAKQLHKDLLQKIKDKTIFV
jgi:hypothetical protein